MPRLAFVLFFASALGLLAVPTSTHQHGALDIQSLRCPKRYCYGFLTISLKFPPPGFTKAYDCSSGHLIYLH